MIYELDNRISGNQKTKYYIYNLGSDFDTLDYKIIEPPSELPLQNLLYILYI